MGWKEYYLEFLQEELYTIFIDFDSGLDYNAVAHKAKIAHEWF